MHKLLARQLRRFFGAADAAPEPLRPFVDAVEQAYRQSDEDRAMLEHSMETVSLELADRYQRLHDAIEQRDEVTHALSLLSATLESTADGILVVDLAGTPVRYNQKFVEIWNAPAEVLERAGEGGLRAHALALVVDPDAYERRVRAIYAQPDAPSSDIIRLKDGRAFERTSQPQRMRDVTVGRVWSFRDISAKRELEEQLRQSQKMEAVGQLAGGVAHDFNNLLTVIRAHAEFLAEDVGESASLREDVDAIIKAARRASGLTQQLLAFSRKQILQPVVFDINTVVLGVEPMLRRLIGEDIAMVTQAAPHPAWVEADPGQMEQVIMNLVINARDAMPRGGRLLITVEAVVLNGDPVPGETVAPSGDFVVLAVRDTGAGIPAALLDRIFEPFFTTKEVGKGTGLGLSTLYGIVQQSGGHVRVESEVAVGTTFRVFLPRAERVATRTSAPTQQVVERGRADKATVLVAEDEAEVGHLLRRVLEGQGHRVLPARNGTEALQLAEHYPGPIDLLVTDVIMPEMGGRELAEQLRRTRRDIRILYISGYTNNEIDRGGVLQPDTAFLQKPFTGPQLLVAVRAVLDQTPALGAPA